MLSDDELNALIEVGVELRNVEFKGPGSTSSTEFIATVARACIAMANQRDGGHVVIGVVDNDPGGASGGLDAAQLAEWLDHDTVTAKVNVYADPPLRLTAAERSLPTGAPVVVIEVAEFNDIPILSAKEFSGKITRGQLYTRSMAKPESSASNTQNELREVLSLATEKQLETFMRTARHVGLSVATGGASDSDQFSAERERFLQHEIANDLNAVANISVAISPEAYDADRLGFEDLQGIVGRSTVSLRGWPFPYTRSVEYGDRWVGDREARTNPEAWGLHQSAQFVDIQPLPTGYDRDSDGFHDADSTGPYLPVWFPLAYTTQAVVFAARLQKEVELDHLTVAFRVTGAKGWELVAADPRRSGFHRSYRLGTNQWEYTLPVETGMLPEDLEGRAAEATRDFLVRFGWTGVTIDMLRAMQAEMLR